MTPPALFGQMTALADPTRSRLLLALERNELTVNELRSILQLPQSTISRHLKMLSAEGWVEARAAGTSRHYRIASSSLDPASRKLWSIVRDEVTHTNAADQDATDVAKGTVARFQGSSESGTTTKTWRPGLFSGHPTA